MPKTNAPRINLFKPASRPTTPHSSTGVAWSRLSLETFYWKLSCAMTTFPCWCACVITMIHFSSVCYRVAILVLPCRHCSFGWSICTENHFYLKSFSLESITNHILLNQFSTQANLRECHLNELRLFIHIYILNRCAAAVLGFVPSSAANREYSGWLTERVLKPARKLSLSCPAKVLDLTKSQIWSRSYIFSIAVRPAASGFVHI